MSMNSEITPSDEDRRKDRGVSPQSNKLAPISDLFDTARDAAVAGHYAEKERIYRDILQRPDATEGDVFRVEVYFADLVRRGGDPDSAEQSLLSLPLPSEPLEIEVLAEFYQALGQCQFMRHEFGAALNTQLVIIEHAEFDLLPTDKQLYFLEAGLAFQMKTDAESPQIEEWLSCYKDVLDTAKDLSTPAHSRALATYHCLSGEQILSINGDNSIARDHFENCFDIAPAPRNKLLAAAYCLSLHHQSQAETSRCEEFESYFMQNCGQIQPTDLLGAPVLKEVLDRLGLG